MMIVQAILTGLYITTFFHCLRWLVFTDEGWRLRKNIDWPILSVTVLVFILTYTSLVIMVKWEFLFIRGDIASLNITMTDKLLAGINEFITLLILDAVLVHRCWTINSRSWRITLFPVMSWLASTVSFIVAIFNARIVFGAPQWESIAPFKRRGTVAEGIFYTCNITTTVYTTCAIIYRIRSFVKDSIGCKKHLHHGARIIAESGILYTSATIIYVIGLFLGNESSRSFAFQHVFGAINYATAGITFHLIVIRINQNRVNSCADSLNGSGENMSTRLQFHPSLNTGLESDTSSDTAGDLVGRKGNF
jgi:hypothetical protein